MHICSNKQNNPTLHWIPKDTRHNLRLCATFCSLGLSWYKADNVLKSNRLSRKITYVYYLNYEKKDEILQTSGSVLIRTYHVSIGKFTSIVIIQTGNV